MRRHSTYVLQEVLLRSAIWQLLRCSIRPTSSHFLVGPVGPGGGDTGPSGATGPTGVMGPTGAGDTNPDAPAPGAPAAPASPPAPGDADPGASLTGNLNLSANAGL